MSSITRREFVRLGAGAAALSAGAPPLAARTLDLPAALQLYSVRDLLPRNFDGTLSQVRSAGYSVVEAAGSYDRLATVFLKSIEAAGLRCVSAHFTLAVLEAQLQPTIDFAIIPGLEF